MFVLFQKVGILGGEASWITKCPTLVDIEQPAGNVLEQTEDECKTMREKRTYIVISVEQNQEGRYGWGEKQEPILCEAVWMKTASAISQSYFVYQVLSVSVKRCEINIGASFIVDHGRMICSEKPGVNVGVR